MHAITRQVVAESAFAFLAVIIGPLNRGGLEGAVVVVVVVVAAAALVVVVVVVVVVVAVVVVVVVAVVVVVDLDDQVNAFVEG